MAKAALNPSAEDKNEISAAMTKMKTSWVALVGVLFQVLPGSSSWRKNTDC